MPSFSVSDSINVAESFTGYPDPLLIDVVDIANVSDTPDLTVDRYFPEDPAVHHLRVEGIEFRTLVSRFESGAEQRRAKWTSPRRKFTLYYNLLSNAEATTLFNFFVSRKGMYEAFYFTNPEDSTTYTVRFNMDIADKETFIRHVYNWGLELVEIPS